MKKKKTTNKNHAETQPESGRKIHRNYKLAPDVDSMLRTYAGICGMSLTGFIEECVRQSGRELVEKILKDRQDALDKLKKGR